MIDQATGQSLLRLTIRIAVACYVWRTLLQIDVRFRRTTITQCAVWAAGCLFYLLHVGLAFAFVHGWSHTSALEHTAAETARLTGIRRGEGLWVNYLLSVIWIADVIRISAARILGRATNRYIDYAVAGFFAFIVFNATVVFGPSTYRWLAVPVGIMLVAAWIRSSRESSTRIE